MSEQSINTAEANINLRIAELNNVNRIVTNTINLITDVDIKGGHAKPVAEILAWLDGFSKTLTTQVQALEATLPKAEVKETKPEVATV